MAEDDVRRRVPPQNLEAEQCVLGSILLDNAALDTALETGLTAADFYRTSHDEIFRAMFALREQEKPIDAISLKDYFRAAGRLDQIGGAAYIAELGSLVPSAASVGYYATVVRDRCLLRHAARELHEMWDSCYSAVNAQEFLDDVDHRLFALTERRVRQSFQPMPELMRDSVKLFEQIYENKSLLTGVATGFQDLDRLLGGLQRGHLVVFAARPSMGKSALALNVAAHAAAEGSAVAFFSLEMSRQELGLRLLCSEARVDMAKARAGYLAQSDFPRLAEAADRLARAALFVDDDSNVSAPQVKAKCRRLARDKRLARLGLVVVDYLQLMRPGMNVERRDLDVADVTRSLKALAKELDVPVLALSQLNRQVESRPNRRPLLADLRESGAIEQDADEVAFIYREEMYQRDCDEPGMAEIIVAKQRNGPTDVIKLAYQREFTRFADYAPPPPDPWDADRG